MGATTIVTGAICLVVGIGIGIGAKVLVDNYKENKRKQQFIDEFKDMDLNNSNVNLNIG